MPQHADFERCSVCQDHLHFLEYTYTIDQFGAPLCNPCAKARLKKATPYEKKLHAALRREKINALLQYTDGHKTIDIAIKDASLYIEVDGPYHQSLEQQITDSLRDLYSRKAGFDTIRIPNSRVHNSIADTVRQIKSLHDKKRSARNRNDGLQSLF